MSITRTKNAEYLRAYRKRKYDDSMADFNKRRQSEIPAAIRLMVKRVDLNLSLISLTERRHLSRRAHVGPRAQLKFFGSGAELYEIPGLGASA